MITSGEESDPAEENGTGTRLDSGEIRGVLEERAARLAKPSVAENVLDELEVVVFGLAGELYAVETGFVFAAFPLLDIAPIPGASPPLYGLTLWQGQIITVADLRSSLGASTTALNDLSRVILLGRDEPEAGVLADSLHGIRHYQRDSLTTAGAEAGRAARFVSALAPDAVGVLNVPAVLASLALRRQA